MKLRLACALSALSVAAPAAFAQDEPQAPIPFEGGTLTITETEDLDKVLAFDGKNGVEELKGNVMLSLSFGLTGPEDVSDIEAWGWDNHRGRYNYYKLDG